MLVTCPGRLDVSLTDREFMFAVRMFELKGTTALEGRFVVA